MLLCAQYVALCGMPFMRYLVQQFAGHEDFGFLKPSTEFNKCFLHTISLLRKLLQADERVVKWAEQYAEPSLRKLGARLKLVQEQREAAREAEKSSSQLAAAVVESVAERFVTHFVVVADVRFNEHDESAELPPVLLSLNEDEAAADVAEIERQVRSTFPRGAVAAEPAGEAVERVREGDEEILVVRDYKRARVQ